MKLPRSVTLAAVAVALMASVGATGRWMRPVQTDAHAQLRCTVSSVHDGDSMRVRCPGERGSVALRMRQIDAPELEQAYGIFARDHLRKFCPPGSVATIRSDGRDQYGRLLGDVDCHGESVNALMVGAGAAWVYDRYAQDRQLYVVQERARQARVGLWSQAAPQPPWRWRQQQPRRN